MGELVGLGVGGGDDSAGDVLRVCGEGISGCGRGDGVGAGRHCECSRVVNGDVEVEIVRTEV